MTNQLLLSSLCSICHANPPKYKCPRCCTKTCSLNCVTRHKTRAECSGERDQTEYMKRKQLYTASGVDHDFNFIRGIERGVDLAEKLFSEATDSGRQGEHKRQYALAQALRRSGVTLLSAPIGLSRRQENKTRWAHGSKRIFWTVEWLGDDGSRHLDDVGEDVPLDVAYSYQLRRESNIGTELLREHKRRKPNNMDQNRKQHDKSQSNIPALVPAPELQVVEQLGTSALLEARATESRPTTESESNIINIGKDETTAHSWSEVQHEHGKSQAPSTIPYGISDTAKADEQTTPRHLADSTNKDGHYFYLVKPRTSTRRTVLIALSPTDSLLQALRGQTVLEYPSIYVLLQQPSQLSEQYELADASTKQVGEYQGPRQHQDSKHEVGITESVAIDPPHEHRAETMGASIESAPIIPNSDDVMAIQQGDVLS